MAEHTNYSIKFTCHGINLTRTPDNVSSTPTGTPDMPAPTNGPTRDGEGRSRYYSGESRDRSGPERGTRDRDYQPTGRRDRERGWPTDRSFGPDWPVRYMPEGKYPFLKNVRATQIDRITPRPGTTPIGDSLSAADVIIHSIRRLNDYTSSSWTRVIGVGAAIQIGQTTYSAADTGYSENPLTLLPLRPSQSPRPWMYVADSSRMRKILVDGTVHSIGCPPPTTPPTLALGVPIIRTVDSFEGYANDGAVQAEWVEGGDAANPTLVLRVDPASITISQIAFDSGTTGWACISPSSMTNILPGMMLTINAGGGTEEIVRVRDVKKASTATTIANITYESGTTGVCTVVLTTPLREIEVDSLVRVAGAENCRVLAVTYGPTGTQSIRISTASNRAATNAIQALGSFRAYCTATHAAAETLRSRTCQSVLTFSTGKGTLTNAGALDLSYLAAGTPTSPDDYIHLGVFISDLSLFKEGRLLLDIDPATNDFTQNYFVYAFRPSDLVPAITGLETFVDQVTETKPLTDTQTVIDALWQNKAEMEQRLEQVKNEPWHYGQESQIQSLEAAIANMQAQIDELIASQGAGSGTGTGTGSGSGSSTIGTGASQWHELIFKVSDLLQVGADGSRNLQHVASIRVEFNLTATITVRLGSIYLTGGYGPDVNTSDYLYRYRGRVSSTGVRSNWSPVTRAGIDPHRELVIVTLTGHSTTEVDKLDVQRWDGELGWRTLGSVADGATPSFTDIYNAIAISASDSEGQVNFQPWPIVSTPTSGTTAANGVCGTLVTDSGTTFNTSWAPGTIIKINGVNYVIYRVLSTSKLELASNAGNQSSVSWEIPEPVLLGQPLPTLWGPYEGFCFACGDLKNPGTLYFTRGNEYDSTTEAHKLEVTSPSEPLMNGGVYNGRAFVFSTERLFIIYPTFQETSPFRVQEVPNAKGLFARWAMAIGPMIWFLSKDGIYETDLTEPVSITDDDLYPLFPHEGQAGTTTNGILAPLLTSPTRLRLAYSDSHLYFDYLATGGTSYVTLVCYVPRHAWLYDVMGTDGTVAFWTCHYGEEGKDVHTTLCGVAFDDLVTPAVFLCSVGGVKDLAATAISCEVDTPYIDLGDARTRKLFADIMVDLHTNSTAVTVTPGFNNRSTTPTGTGITNAARTQHLLELGSTAGLGTEARDISLILTWSSATATPQLYGWDFSVLPRPMVTQRRATDWDDCGTPGIKQFRVLLLDGDTINQQRSIKIMRDNDTLQETITVQQNGRVSLPYGLTPFKAHRVKILPNDDYPWQLYGASWLTDDRPELATITTDYTDCGLPTPKWMRGVWIKCDTENTARSVQVQYDMTTVGATLTVNHNGEKGVFYPFTSPFYARQIRLVPNGPWRLIKYEFLYSEHPELTNAINDWSDLGFPEEKLLQGMVIHGDTENVAAAVTVQYDGASTLGPYPVTQSGQRSTPIAFATTPLAHLVRISVSTGTIRDFHVEWIYKKKSSLAAYITDWMDCGHKGAKKINGIKAMRCDTANQPITVQFQYDGANGQLLTVQNNGDRSLPYEFTTPVYAHLVKLVPSGAWRLYDIEWDYTPVPENITQATEWTDAGYQGAKFMQGLKALRVDTSNAALSVQTQYDGGTVGATNTVQHNGDISKPYSFTTPFIAHLVRLVPSADWRYYSCWWQYEPAPELASTWKTPPITFELPGWLVIRDFYIAHMSTADISLVVRLDQVSQTVLTIAHNSGAYKKSHVPTPVYKAKSVEFWFTSAASFRLFKQDCEVGVKSWGSEDPFRIAKPFGGLSVQSGAEV